MTENGTKIALRLRAAESTEDLEAKLDLLTEVVQLLVQDFNDVACRVDRSLR